MVMEKLFNGEIYPSETVVPSGDVYRESNLKIGQILDGFAQTMSKKEYEKIEELMDLINTAENEMNLAQFRYGVSLGVSLMLESIGYPEK